MNLIHVVAIATAFLLILPPAYAEAPDLFDSFVFLDTLACQLSGQTPAEAVISDAGAGKYGFSFLFTSYGFSVALGSGEMHTYRYIASGQGIDTDAMTWLPVPFSTAFGLAGCALDAIRSNAADYLAHTIAALTNSGMDPQTMCKVYIGVTSDDIGSVYFFNYNMLTDQLSINCNAK